MNIQWYPGHMTKTRRQMAEYIKQVDAVCEVVDARIPQVSRNPDMDEIAAGRPRMMILNRIDLADPNKTAVWAKYFRDQGMAVMQTDSRAGTGTQAFSNAVRTLLADKIAQWNEKGLVGKSVRVMVVGIPNVGKSTLLSMVSAARPKIANYHFTTLVPNLGVVSVGEEQNFVMADIPGIIEGASEGAGLGHDFLRHIDRCRLLLHLVDAAGSEGRDPIDDIEKINAELAGYSEFLAARPQIIVANKTDLLGDDREPVEKLRKYAEEHGFLFAELSAATNQGVKELMNLTWHELQQLPPVFVYEPEFVETEAAPVTENDWTIERDGDAYVVTGAWVDKVMGSVNLDDYESRQYMDRMLQTAGIYAKLEEMGIEEGAPVIIGELEFEYVY